MGDGAGRGRGFAASRERFHLSGVEASNSGRVGLNFSSKGAKNSATIFARSATIFARSVVDRVPNASELSIDGRGVDSARQELRSRLDRTAIVAFFHASSLPSDEDLIVMTIPPVRWRSDAPGGSTRVEKVANDRGRPMMIG